MLRAEEEGTSGVDGVGSRRASSREIQLPLNKLIHCRRPSATSVDARSNNPLFPPPWRSHSTLSSVSFLFSPPLPSPPPISFLLVIHGRRDNLNIGYSLICRFQTELSLLERREKTKREEKGAPKKAEETFRLSSIGVSDGSAKRVIFTRLRPAS